MEYPASTWRLIQSPPGPGAWNMAVDESLLESTIQGKSLPTLRLYAWKPPCLSLGYAQPFTDADLDKLAEHGWDIVRRPTGGRAILHTDELTYAVIAPTNEPRLAGGVLESYLRLSKALLQALTLLTVPAESNAQPSVMPGSDPKGPVCFEVPSNYEITVEGKKLIGSAQARRKGGVLQHGSLPLYGDLGRIVDGLAFPDQNTRQETRQRLYERATTVEAIFGRPVSWEKAAQAYEQAFCQVLNLRFEVSELTGEEIKRAEELVTEKYNHPEWTRRV